MEKSPGPRARAGFLLGIAASSLAAIVVVAGALELAGCARSSGARPEMRGTRLTHDAVVKYCVRFSPDGKLIAYTARPSGERQTYGIFVVPREGGEPRRISPDSVGVLGLGWSADGSAIYGRAEEGDKIYRIGLHGSVERVDNADPLTRVVGISPDGKIELVVRFNGDNRDAGTRAPGGEIQFLGATPVWEEDAVFGPGRGEVTVVAMPSFQAPVSTISIWSPQTRKYTPLPLPEGQNSQPAWSPDGRHLAYVSAQNSQTDLWMYDARTARAAPLTSDPGDVAYPAWSPDGAWLAFCRSNKTSHIFSGDPRKAAPRQLTEGAALDYAPMVSPDGKWVVFLRRAGRGSAGQSGPGLCVMPSAGGRVAELDLQGVQLPGKSAEAISWSQDSRWIAFSGLAGSGKMDIYRVGRDGANLARVTVEPGEELDPRWSPDGRYLCYTRAGGGGLQVAVIPANGGLSRTVSPADAKSEGGLWGPSSDRLAFVSYGKGNTFEIWITSPEKPAERTRLLVDSAVVWPVFWSKDGREIILARRSSAGWYFAARSIESGEEVRIGKPVMLSSGRQDIVDLEARGEKYQDLFYPGGAHIFADGQDNADIYLVRTRELLGSRFLAGRGE